MLASLPKILAALLLMVGIAFAEDLVLKDGRYLQVDILQADERGLMIRRLDNGGELFIPWALVRDADQERIKLAFGLIEEEIVEPTVDGVRLVTKDGAEFFGVLVTPFDGQTVPPEVEIMLDGNKQVFKKEVIRRIDQTQVPALSAYSAEQLYQMELERVQPGETEVDPHLAMARYAQSVTLPERALFHLLKVQEIAPEYEPEWMANQLERLEVLAKNQEIAKQIRNARRIASGRRFDDALEQLDLIAGMADTPALLKKEAELAAADIAKRRERYFTKEVRKEYFHRLKIIVREIASDRKMTLREAQSEVRRNVHKLVLAAVGEKLGLDVKKEVTPFWDNRVVNQPRVSSYESGSFIVLGKAPGAEERDRALQRQLARARAEEARRNRGGSSIQGGIPDFPKPPTRDDWYKRAATARRTNFLLAYFAENGKTMQVVGERKTECQRCAGQRTIGFAGSQGQVLRVTCPRCAGHGYDKGVAYK